MENTKYVHGYTNREATRLNDQANTLDELIHNDTIFKKNSLILEAGCGVGAQTKIIAPKNPDSKFISIDISQESINEAGQLTDSLGISNVEFEQADIFSLPFKDEVFDGIIVCFVLEHVNNPASALKELLRVLKKDGTLIAIEGDHGSTFFYPDSQYAHDAIDCQVQLQKQHGGNSNIGRELYPLMDSVGLTDISVTPRVVYADDSRPNLVEGFIKNTFTAMIEGVEEEAIQQGLMKSDSFKQGIKDLYRTAEPDGVFSYTFFKGFGTKK
jgi:SAM-dependent methyltransferase